MNVKAWLDNELTQQKYSSALGILHKLMTYAPFVLEREFTAEFEVAELDKEKRALIFPHDNSEVLYFSDPNETADLKYCSMYLAVVMPDVGDDLEDHPRLNEIEQEISALIDEHPTSSEAPDEVKAQIRALHKESQDIAHKHIQAGTTVYAVKNPELAF